jgi:hypothetical protein
MFAALASCGGDDPTDPNTGVSGAMSFSYTGAGASSSTTFSASGSIPLNVGSDTSSNLGSGAWAAGSVSPTANYVIVGGVIPRSSTAWDITQVSAARKTVGTSTIDPNCDAEATNCTGVFVFFNFNGNGDTFSYLCQLTTGTVTISAISSTNITGTFSGTGQCFTALGATSNFTVNNGTFNVGVTTQLLP